MSVGIANTINAPALYVTRPPDWGLPVVLTLTHSTNIFTARSGKEQRTRTMARPKARLAYTIRGLSQSEALTGKALAAAEVRSPLWAPFWSEGAVVVQVPTSTSITINVDPTADFFAKGQKVFVGGEFLDVVAVVGRTLTLATAPTVSPLNATAYPARLSKRVMGSDAMRRQSGRTHSENVIYESID